MAAETRRTWTAKIRVANGLLVRFVLWLVTETQQVVFVTDQCQRQEFCSSLFHS